MSELATRGTTNQNVRGSSYDRAARRKYLIETYRADVDVYNGLHGPMSWDRFGILSAPLGKGDPACRCYRCGVLLMEDTVTVDRIVPGCKGGTYRRNNIRPACATCNSSTGAKLARRPK